MPISIKKLTTMYLETVQKTTNRFASSQEWYAFPAATSLSTTSTTLETQSSGSTTNLIVPDDSLQAPPRKGSWDISYMPETALDNKEEKELESMIQCTSTFF